MQPKFNTSLKPYCQPNRRTRSGFVPPTKDRRLKALGVTEPKTLATKISIEDAEKAWIPTRTPESGDWLDSYNHGGQGFDKFGGKAYSNSFNTLYLQPITHEKGSKITDDLLGKLQKWCQAVYFPCKVVVLDRISDKVLKSNRRIDTQENDFGETQFNAIHILKEVIGPIQQRQPNCIGVLSLTDVDLFTKSLSNYCFGYGIPAYGGVQSIRRYMPDFTDEHFSCEKDFQDALLMRVCKIGAHELGHMFGLMHCIYYQCLMMGTNHIG